MAETPQPKFERLVHSQPVNCPSAWSWGVLKGERVWRRETLFSLSLIPLPIPSPLFSIHKTHSSLLLFISFTYTPHSHNDLALFFTLHLLSSTSTLIVRSMPGFAKFDFDKQSAEVPGTRTEGATGKESPLPLSQVLFICALP